MSYACIMVGFSWAELSRAGTTRAEPGTTCDGAILAVIMQSCYYLR